MSGFGSAEECREVIGRAFELMSRHPEMGPKLRYADTPQRWEFPDLDLVVNVAAGEADENLVWEWGGASSRQPEVTMTMDSAIANRYFQGKENIAMAIARRRIRTSGNVKKALTLVPITKPVFALYRAMLEDEYPHLLA